MNVHDLTIFSNHELNTLYNRVIIEFQVVIKNSI